MQFLIAFTGFFGRSDQFLFLLIKPRQNIGVLTHHFFFARNIGGKLLKTLYQLGPTGTKPLAFLVQLGSGNGEALQCGRSLCFGFTQFRQLVRADSLRLCGVHLRLCHIANSRSCLRQCALRLAFLYLCL